MRTAFLIGGAMVCFGLGPIFEKLSLREASPMGLLTIRTVMLSILLLLLLLVSGRTHEVLRMTPMTYVWIAASALVGGFLGLMFYFTALKDGLASQVVAIIAAFPLITALVAVVALGEPYTLRRLVGTVLVVAGLFFVW